MSKSSTRDSSVNSVLGASPSQNDVLKKLEEFKEFYEGRINEIDVRGGGDNSEIKIEVQRMWIEDLTEQTHMMAEMLQELEDEANTRVRMLENKLKQTSKSAYEVMKRYHTYSINHNLDEPFQKVFYLENDLKNVLEFIRRVRVNQKWNIDGLNFYNVTHKDLFGVDGTIVESYGVGSKKESEPSNGNNCTPTDTEPPDDLVEQLKKKTDEYEELRQSMLDMRCALTEEVACKHDMISALKRDVQQLEERCIQSDKQTAFKDDIIKELRKEIKQLKHQESPSFLDESINKVLQQIQNMKKKVKQFYLKHTRTQSKIKDLEYDNNSKIVLLGALYNTVKGLLYKIVPENRQKYGDMYLVEYSELKGNITKIMEFQEKEADLNKQLEEERSKFKRMRPCVETRSMCTGTVPPEKKSVSIVTEEDLVIPTSKLLQNKDDTIQIQNNTLNVIDFELQALKKREKDLEEEITKRKREVDDLKCKCTDLEKQLTNSQGRADNLQKAVDLYLNSINVLEAAEEKARLEIEQQKMTISNLQEVVVTLKQELDQLRQNTQQEIVTCQHLCNIFYVNLLDLEEHNTCISESYKKLQECNFELEVEHFSSLQDVALLETQLYKYQTEFRNYEEKRVASKDEVKKLLQQNRYYSHMIDCYKNEMTVMSEQLIHVQEMLKLSNKSCKEENCQFSTALVELQKRSEKLRTQLTDMERKVLIENQKNQLKDAKIDELQTVIGQKNADLNLHDDAINDMKLKLENALLENHRLQGAVASMDRKMVQMDVERKSHKVVSRKHRSSHCLSECRSERKKDYDVMLKELERVKAKNKDKIRNLKRQNEELKDQLATSELNRQNLKKQLAHLKEQTSSMCQQECYREHELAQSKQVIIELRQTMIELNESLADNELHSAALAEEFHKNSGRVEDDIYLSCKCEIALYKKLAENFKSALLEARKKVNDIECKNRALCEDIKCHECKINELQKKATKKEKENCQCIENLRESLQESHEKEKRLADFCDTLKEELQKKEMQKIMFTCCECSDMKATQEEINSLKSEIRNMIQNQLALNNENDKLLKQVTCLQTHVATVEENNRYLKQKLEKLQTDNQHLKEKNKAVAREKETYVQTIRNLELELAETKNCRDDICAESRQVISNVKEWLSEQRKIDEKFKKKTAYYCDTIAKLRDEKESLQTARPPPMYERPFQQRACTPVDCPWSMGSQGTGSPRESLASCSCSVEEWYSPNYRDEETEEEFVNVLEATVLEMRNNNKKWKNRFQEFVVTRDDK